MLPRIAVIGEFQEGKSLVLNSILGSPSLPVGESGFRTTPCPVYCEYGPLDRVELNFKNHAPVHSSCELLHSSGLEKDLPEVPRVATLLLNRPILSEFTLVDTPGLDYSDSDDEQAFRAISSADGVLVVTTRQLASGKPTFEKLVKILRSKPWGLVLNCGRSGPHLENSGSRAAREVLDACLQQLDVAGVPAPDFSHSLSVRTMFSLVGNREDRQRLYDSSNPETQEALSRDERSVEVLREKLQKFALSSREHTLNRFLPSIEALIQDEGGELAECHWKQSPDRFHAKLKGEWGPLSISGDYQLERSSSGYQLQLHPIEASESWTLDLIKESLPPLVWTMGYPDCS